MASLTDGDIRKAIKRVEKSDKQETLADGEGRGTGRLILLLKPMPTRVTTDWYAQQWRDGKRTKSKIGSYPVMGLAAAREVFQRDFAGAIQKKASIKVAGDKRPGTVADLFDAYVDHLQASGKPSWKEAKKGMAKIASTLGPNRLAREIEPDDVLAVLKPIYDRGAKSMADHVRSYIRSAYSWGMKSEHDYRSTSARRFKLVMNPAAGIPTEPKNPGTRWLRPEEYKQLYRWLECPDRPIHAPYTYAMRLLMLTGQRVEEIATLHVDQWNRDERMIDWSKTKNGKPHTIPAPQIAFDLIESLTPNAWGWFFPSMMDPSKSVSHGTLYAFLWRQRERGVVPMVSNRDMRRTWKTLAGEAGVSKEMRDRLQNHLMDSGVSTIHYDRYSYLEEKRAAMEKWNVYVTALLAHEAKALAA